MQNASLALDQTPAIGQPALASTIYLLLGSPVFSSSIYKMAPEIGGI